MCAICGIHGSSAGVAALDSHFPGLEGISWGTSEWDLDIGMAVRVTLQAMKLQEGCTKASNWLQLVRSLSMKQGKCNFAFCMDNTCGKFMKSKTPQCWRRSGTGGLWSMQSSLLEGTWHQCRRNSWRTGPITWQEIYSFSDFEAPNASSEVDKTDKIRPHVFLVLSLCRFG